MQVTLRAAQVRHLSAARGAAPTLASLTLALAPGEQVAVIGPSGAGKTTLLHAMACALRPSAGRVELDGQDPWSLGAAALRRLRGRLFLAPQVPPLPPRQRVVTAVLAGRLPHTGLLASLRSLVYPVGIAQAQAALARFDLADKLFERVDRLSGGERQRVGLARALVAEAGLLLVDEPLSALDPARAGLALQSLSQAARDRNATLVCTMHDVPMALRHFPRVLALRDGALCFDLPAAAVTPERLMALYDQHLDELKGPVPEPGMLPAPPRTAPYCR
ncbi:MULTISPECIES: ATP-binding cassette domain-containing protein [Ramlibacter]|uniref:ATP-binding cassette domain-containing protein n=1 Tax=Ramlibacter pinisoli TaxID=2682844 RepID=A0A6N8ISY7_9BURK|nr:ATP-binding cassette domain-containing protein [Ramlibacter sp. CGMCC 1.13660]MVQ30039.1 ATP-binding cassette domain-containing protein [Ramlibacter pinisoli]